MISGKTNDRSIRFFLLQQRNMGAVLSGPTPEPFICGNGTLKINRTCIIDPSEYIKKSKATTCGVDTYLAQGNVCRSNVECGNTGSGDTTSNPTNSLTCGEGTYRQDNLCLPFANRGNDTGNDSSCKDLYRCDPLTTKQTFNAHGGYVHCSIDTDKYSMMTCGEGTKPKTGVPNVCRVDETKWEPKTSHLSTRSDREDLHKSSEEIQQDLANSNAQNYEKIGW